MKLLKELLTESPKQPGPVKWQGQSYGPETWVSGKPEPISLSMASFAAKKEDGSYLYNYFANYSDGVWKLEFEDHTDYSKVPYAKGDNKKTPKIKVLGTKFKTMEDVYKAAMKHWKGPEL